MSEIKMNFDIDVAKNVGTDAAIILSNIKFWITTNKANRRHFYNGNYWMYNSAKAFTELFEWLSDSQIKTCLNKLEKNNYIVTGNYNKSTYDRTKWYAVPVNTTISEKSLMDSGKIANGLANNRQPIPDNNTYNKPIEENASFQDATLFPQSGLPTETLKTLPKKEKEGDAGKIDFDALLAYYNKVSGRKCRIMPNDAKKSLQMRLKEGYGKSDVKNAIDNAFQDEFHRKDNFRCVTLEFIFRSKIFDRYASMSAVANEGKKDPDAFYNA